MSDKEETRAALLHHAATLVQRLERMVSDVGGYSSPQDQALVREARAFLVDLGYRPRVLDDPGYLVPWEDRKHTCERLADGTGATREAPCELCRLQVVTRP